MTNFHFLKLRLLSGWLVPNYCKWYTHTHTHWSKYLKMIVKLYTSGLWFRFSEFTHNLMLSKNTLAISPWCPERYHVDLRHSVLNIITVLWTKEVHADLAGMLQEKLKTLWKTAILHLYSSCGCFVGNDVMRLGHLRWPLTSWLLTSHCLECFVAVFCPGRGFGWLKGTMVSELSNLCTHSIIYGHR